MLWFHWYMATEQQQTSRALGLDHRESKITCCARGVNFGPSRWNSPWRLFFSWKLSLGNMGILQKMGSSRGPDVVSLHSQLVIGRHASCGMVCLLLVCSICFAFGTIQSAFRDPRQLLKCTTASDIPQVVQMLDPRKTCRSSLLPAVQAIISRIEIPDFQKIQKK